MADVVRCATPADLARTAAAQLVDAITALQAGGARAEIAVTGGRTVEGTFTELGALIAASQVDPGRLELWWTDELFLPTGDPDRYAGRALALLAGKFPLDPARTHPMPSADGVLDNAASAALYERELQDTHLNIALVTLGATGSVAALFPGHAAYERTDHRVVAVNDAPELPAERISLSADTISDADEVWYLVSGRAKAKVLTTALSDDPTIPAGLVRGRQHTRWFVDAEAASELVEFHCRF